MRKPEIKDSGLFPFECGGCGGVEFKVTRTVKRKFFRMRRVVCENCGCWTLSIERVTGVWNTGNNKK